MWIELHDNLPDHPKVVKLSKLLNMDRDLARAKLERLWLWALNNRLNGVLSDDDVLLLEDIMRLKGKQSETMVDALVQCNLLDPVEGGYSIHDWDDHAGMLIDKKTIQREQSRLRKQKQRDMAKKISGTSVTCHADVTRDMSVTDVTIPAEVTRENRDCHAPTVTYTNTYTYTELNNNEDKKEIDKEKAPKVVRHKYGVYGNVLLSDADMEKLKAEFPNDWEQRIERLSEYIASKGAKYKDHLATIRSWARKEKPNAKHGRDTGSAFDAVGTYL